MVWSQGSRLLSYGLVPGSGPRAAGSSLMVWSEGSGLGALVSGRQDRSVLRAVDSTREGLVSGQQAPL